MNNLGKSLVCGLAALFATTIMAAAPSTATQFTPKLMNYQGYLANPSTGNAVSDGIYSIQCRIYRQASGGTAIWGGTYSVYVNKGYFNIMLGDTSATDLGYTYANADVWRALWSDTSVSSSSRNDLWLGVTIPSISASEIAPRQQLLTAPYAFRAQAAEYANQSVGNFKVNGTLSADSWSWPSTLSVGGLSVTSSSVSLAGTSSGSSNPYLYSYAKYAYFYPYYDMNIQPTAGNVNITIPSGKYLNIKNNNLSVNNAASTMYSSGSTSISAGGSLTLKGTSSISIQTATNNYIWGAGTLSWAIPGGSGSIRPFQVRQVEVSFASGTRSMNVDIPGSAASGCTWMVVGWNTKQFGMPPLVACMCSKDGTTAYVHAELQTAPSTTYTYYIHVLGISNSFTQDYR